MFHAVGLRLSRRADGGLNTVTGMSRSQYDQSFDSTSLHGAAPARAASHFRFQHVRCCIPASAACARISEHLARLG